jgi:hypothetical protein
MHPFRPGRVVLALLLTAGCSRQIELYEPTDAGISVVEGPTPPDDIPEVSDSGVRAAGLLECAERPTGDCVGANDFPCDFQRWVEVTADACYTEVDCRVQGWLGVALADDGCVEAIEMTDPAPDFVACLVERFAHYGCVQCTAQRATRFLGTTAEACMIRCINAGDCPDGYTCTGQLCERDLH